MQLEQTFPADAVADLVRRALDEDLGPQHLDVTTLATIPAQQERTAHVVARADGVVAGLAVVAEATQQVAVLIGLPAPEVALLSADGDRVTRGAVLAVVTGRTQVILVAERTLLNVLSRLSGVATHTRRWADALEGTGATVPDTRKTTPGMRHLEKYAVRAGGGTNKRMGLYDVAMVKDNHKLAAGSVAAAYAAVRASYPAVEVEVEVTVEAPLAAPSPTYSASPMSNVHDSPSPKVIGVCADRLATQEPFWMAPSQGASFCFGIVSDPVANVAIAFSF